MNWRLMRYWSSLRGDEPYARISEFNVEAVPGFGPHAFMLDLNDTEEDPLVRFVGQSLSQECGLNMTGKRLSAVPQDSLLARVANHYRDVQVAKAPFEFADEYVNERKELVLYRGIMLPFTRGGRSIDYIVGAITNKKEVAEEFDGKSQLAEAREPASEAGGLDAQALLSMVESDVAGDPPPAEPAIPPADLGSLTSSLEACQTLARKIEAADARSRKSLYETLDRVYRFAFEAEEDPGALQTLMGAAGLTMQERAPFTPIVKLVFGKDYSKTRLSEYEAALGHAKRQGQPASAFRDFVERHPGGLKGCVAAERAARRAERGDRTDKVAQAKERLRALDPIGAFEEPDPGSEEFVLVLGRRGAGSGTVDILVVLDEKQNTLEGALKRAARRSRKRKSKAKPAKAATPEPAAAEPSTIEPSIGGTAVGETAVGGTAVGGAAAPEAASLQERAGQIPGLDEVSGPEEMSRADEIPGFDESLIEGLPADEPERDEPERDEPELDEPELDEIDVEMVEIDPAS